MFTIAVSLCRRCDLDADLVRPCQMSSIEACQLYLLEHDLAVDMVQLELELRVS